MRVSAVRDLRNLKVELSIKRVADQLRAAIGERGPNRAAEPAPQSASVVETAEHDFDDPYVHARNPMST